MKNLTVLLLLLIHFLSITQENESIKLNQIIATGTGYDVNQWCGPENVFLEIDDSTLIVLDEFRTFETGLTLEKSLVLSDKTYRVLLKKDDEIIQTRTFTKDSISKKGNLIVNFNFERCCYIEGLRYIFFSKDSLDISTTYCSDKNSIIEFLSGNNRAIELIGVQNNSNSKPIIQERVKYLETFLVLNGIQKDRIEIKEPKEAKDIRRPFLTGSEYPIAYPEKDE